MAVRTEYLEAVAVVLHNNGFDDLSTEGARLLACVKLQRSGMDHDQAAEAVNALAEID